MIASETLEARINGLHEQGGPFVANEFEDVMGWVWDWKKDAFKYLKNSNDGQDMLNDIFDWFEANPESYPSLSICFPPRSHLSHMNHIQRLQHIRSTLDRRDRILRAMPESISIDLNNHHLLIELNSGVGESGAAQFTIYLDSEVKKNKRAKTTIGTVSLDLSGDAVLIHEVQREKPAGAELYQLEWADVSHMQVATRVSTQKIRLRDLVKQGRVLPNMLSKGVPWPAMEELFVAAVVESMSRAGVITRDMPIELLNELEIICSLEDQYVFDRVYERALGRALVSLGVPYVQSMHIDEKDKVELIKILTSYDELHVQADSAGYYMQYQWKSPYKDAVIKNLLVRRIAPEYALVQLEDILKLDQAVFTKAVMPLTVDYQINYAPYLVAFADLNPTPTPLGRMIMQEQLSQLPFWNKMA